MLYRGVFTALIAPMSGGHLDRTSLIRLLDDQLAHDVDGLVVNGTTGEAATLDDTEQARMVEWVMEHVEGAVPVVAGVGTNHTRTTVARALAMQEMGVDGLLVVTPYYNRPTQAGLVAHFGEVASAVRISVCLYNVPSRTAVSLEPESIAELAALDNVEAIKEATTDVERAARVIAAAGDDVAVMSGDDTALLPMLSLGMRGIVSAVSNVIPAPFTRMFKAYDWGDMDLIRQLHYETLEPTRAMLSVVNPLGVKVAARQMGLIDSDEARLPLTQVDDDRKEVIRRALEAGGLLG